MLIISFSVLPSYAQNRGTYILCYHAFLDRKDPYSFTNEKFREQLLRLKNNGFQFVTFEDMIDGRISGTKNILITIDDGNKSVYQAYYSIMKPLGIKPVLGIYPAIIGRVHYAMTWDELKRLADDGCYIASHGYHHMYLSTKYHDKEPQCFNKEIYYSKKILEEKLGKKIELMVYPFGVSSDIAIAELKNAGYKYGMSLIPKISKVPFVDNFLIPRYLLTKPCQKGTIAYITKNAEALSTASDISREQKSRPLAAGSYENKATIRNYPQKISGMIMNDVIFMPDKKIAKKKSRPKFKPYVHNHKKNVKGNAYKNAKKRQAVSSKKQAENKETRPPVKQSSLHTEIKDYYFALQARFSSIIYSIRELTAAKISLFKTKTISLFS